jgi:hypothetical protein
MCYAISTGADPLGAYHRYEFLRPLFPDYPRPAIWPDGYYVPTSTSDDFIEKHACAADRRRMLRGEAATEQCVVIDGVNFLNNADLEGTSLPPDGAPNIMMAAGGAQLEKRVEDNRILAWTFKVDWDDPSKTRVDGPVAIAVAPYGYLCGGQLTQCVPQPGTERRLDAQGDKIMARLVYRRIGRTESIAGAVPARHLRPGHLLPVDGQSGHRSRRQHRDRLLVRRDARVPRATVRRETRQRSGGTVDAARDGARQGRGIADVYEPMGGLHADGHRSGRRLHDLVCRRLLQERRDQLLDAHRRVQTSWLYGPRMSVAGRLSRGAT